MKALLVAFVAVLSLTAVTAQARVYVSGGYWHGHPRTWWVNHHYHWVNGEWVLLPGYGYGGVAPVYSYSPYRYRHHYYYRHGHPYRRYYY